MGRICDNCDRYEARSVPAASVAGDPMPMLASYGKQDVMTYVGPPRGKVLVVDDDPGVRGLLERLLVEEGFRVEAMGDAAAALAAVAANEPDIVLLDVMLPEHDGLDVLARLRRTTDVPVILLTAKGEEADRIVGLKLGADDYVVKPFSPGELVARVGT